MNAVKPLRTQQSSVGLAAGLVACFGLFFSTPARAEDSAFDHENGWEITGSIYVWAPAITGDTIYGPGFEVSFSDILDNLDFGLVGALEGRRGDWMLLGDLLYFDVSAGRGSTRQVGPILRRGSGFTVERVSKSAIKATVLQFIGGYKLAETKNNLLYGTFGARMLRQDTTLEFEVTGPFGPRKSTVQDSGTTWDAVVGLRGRANINDNWFVNYYADAGTGQSKLTYQGFLGVGYDFGRTDVILGYRHLGWRYDSGPVENVGISGPALVFSFAF